MFISSVSDLTVTNIFSANRLLNSPVGITTHRHNRKSWAVVLKVKGETIYTVGNKKVLSDRYHPVILPKGCDYSWECTKAGECILIEFDANSTLSDFDCFEIRDNSLIINDFEKIEKSLGSKKTECYYYLYEILLFLIRSAQAEPVHPQKALVLKPATDYIHTQYFDSNVTNDMLAELCKMSTVYFRKCFVSVYGVPPMKYLHNLRIQKAKAILNSDFESVGQVAESVGYNSIYHFSKMFRQYTGISPVNYSKQNKNR